MKAGGNKVNGNIQTEAYKHGNMYSIRIRSSDKGSEATCQSGSRKYKQGTQKDMGALQTTLNEFWKGKEKDMQTWLEDMEELERMEQVIAEGSQESILSYV